MKTPETAMTAALLLAALVGVGDLPAERDSWQDGWQAALRQAIKGTAGSPVLLAARRDPGSEYERGYRDGAAYLWEREPMR